MDLAVFDSFSPYPLHESCRFVSMVRFANYRARFGWARGMIGVFPALPFSRESLTSTFGFPIPLPFVTFLNALCQDCTTDEAVCERVADVLQCDLAGEEQRYEQTPPELFPIAGTGVDGGHIGYVIHAPELTLPDYPIARFEPMDGNGVYLLGTSTFEAVETKISFNMRFALEHNWRSLASFDWWPEVSARLTQLGIVPDPSKAGRNYDDGHFRSVIPAVPQGWHYIRSSDGVGVLAPAAQFHPTFSHFLDDRPNSTFVLDAASGHAAQGFPATTLWLLRECYWHTWAPATEDILGLCQGMSEAYSSLGRPSLAAVVDRRIAPMRRR